jgi:hypothetical protein
MEGATPPCGRCGRLDCARPHGWWLRKRVTDLSTGAVTGPIPILRVRFCSGKTVSLLPGELWRGRFTTTSVLEAVVHVLRDGVETACEWAWAAGRGEPVVSPSSLRRWRRIVRERVIRSALAWLGPQCRLSASQTQGGASHLEAILGATTGAVLVAFRTVFGTGLLDTRRECTRQPDPSRRAVPRTSGRHDPGPSHEPVRPVRLRGSWLPRRCRGPPPGRPDGGDR